MEDLRPIGEPTLPFGRRAWRRFWDALAAAIVAAGLFHFFLAPRELKVASARLAPLVIPMLDGSSYHLDRRRGRVVFLDFSASWCEACKASLPLTERYARMHPETDVITIDSGESPFVAARFARERALRPHFLALDRDERLTDAFNVEGYPTIVVVDPQGRMSARWDGYNPAIEAAMEHARATLTSR